jgi:peptidoglycan/xylan/chitin deacetylase (PgdA/CDA1 family)
MLLTALQLVVLFIVLYMLAPFMITRICGLVVVRRGKAARQVAFTFDDGPNPTYTPRLLDLLQAHDVKATFFVLGSQAEKYPEIIKRMHQEGHQIGIHNYSHTANWVMTPGVVRQEQVERTADIVQQITGERPTSYRPPWGIMNLGDLFNFGFRKSYRIVLWSVMVRDWKRSTTAERLRHRLLRKIKPGSIVLLHDCGETLGADEDAPQQMLEGLQDVLEEVRLKGYKCLRIDEMTDKEREKNYQIDSAIVKKQYKSTMP